MFSGFSRPPLVHLAIVGGDAAQQLLSGRKRVESRFLTRRCAPFACVHAGDMLHFKLCGGDLIGTSRVAAVIQYEGLTPGELYRIRRRYGRYILAPPGYWAARRHCRYAVLIWLSPLRPPPGNLRVPRQYGGAWLVLPGAGGVAEIAVGTARRRGLALRRGVPARTNTPG